MTKNLKNPRIILVKIKKYNRFKDIAKSIQLISISILSRYTEFVVQKEYFFSLFFFYGLESLSQYNWSSDLFCSKYYFVVYSTDRSCSGALNSRIFKKVNLILKFSFNIDYLIFSIGLASYFFFKKKYRKAFLLSFYSFEINSFDFVSFYLSHLLFKSNNCDRIFFVFNLYVSRMIQKSVYYTIPSYEIYWSNLWKLKHFFGFFFKNLDYNYDFLLLFVYSKCFFENELSSYGSRAKTMENAVSNTLNTISFLKLKYNRLRQSSITRDIIEILNALIV